MNKNIYKYYVYKLTFPNSKVYIGITKNLKRRFNAYKNCHSNLLVHRAIRKYGWDNIHKDVIDTQITVGATYSLEKKYIAEFQSNNISFGYNNTSGGEKFKRYTLDVRNKMSLSKKGKFLGANNPNFEKGCKGEINGSSKLNWDKVKEIRELAKTGIKLIELAKKYDVWSTTIANIINNTTWIDTCNSPYHRDRKHLVLAVDADGTIWNHTWPNIGSPIKDCKDVMLRLAQRGHMFVLWTARQGRPLQRAIKFLKYNNYPISYFNVNIPNAPYRSKKIYADLYIDDRNIGGLIPWLEIEQIVLKIEQGGNNER